MLPKIKSVSAAKNYELDVTFDDGVRVAYDMNEDIKTLPDYSDLTTITGLFKNVQLDESRTVVFWNDYIDLPSDTIYEYGRKVQ